MCALTTTKGRATDDSARFATTAVSVGERTPSICARTARGTDAGGAASGGLTPPGEEGGGGGKSVSGNHAQHSDSHAFTDSTLNEQQLSSQLPDYLREDYFITDEYFSSFGANHLPAQGQEVAQILLQLPNPQTLQMHISSPARCNLKQTRPPVALRHPYPYTEDLLALESRRPPPSHSVPEWLSQIVTPLRPHAWAAALASHPDRRLRDYICQGITQGFRVGFDHTVSCKPAGRNMPSTKAHPKPVDEFLQQEREAGRIMGPMPRSSLRPVQVNRIGVIPKSTPGKWRLIVDLSFPEGKSVNAGISPGLCHLELASVDDAVHHIIRMGQHSLLAKVDIAQAYRNIPVHPQDRWLLGLMWKGGLYVDTTLPFGLRSAPKIFCAVSDALQWILYQRGLEELVKYIDDLLIIGPPRSPRCGQQLALTKGVCTELGLPLAMEKVVGPIESLEFLGIELDTSAWTIRLPARKLQNLQEELERWARKSACKKRELLSLIGRLAHACKVIPPGRAFLRRMIDLAAKPQKLDHWVRMNEGFRSDLAWWRLFLTRWNGTSMIMPRIAKPTPDVVVFTDASGWGCGGHWNNRWFQYEWPREWVRKSIAMRELAPVVLAAGIWGAQWGQSWVLVKTDNQSVVDIITKKSSSDEGIMHLVRTLQFMMAAFQFELYVQHLPGVTNIAADALSRNSLQVFQREVATADREGVVIPQVLEQLVIRETPDWLSQDWRKRLGIICGWL